MSTCSPSSCFYRRTVIVSKNGVTIKRSNYDVPMTTILYGIFLWQLVKYALNALWPTMFSIGSLARDSCLDSSKNNPSLIVHPKISSKSIFRTYAVTVPFKCHLSIITVAYVGICEIVQRMHAIFGYTVMA